MVQRRRLKRIFITHFSAFSSIYNLIININYLALEMHLTKCEHKLKIVHHVRKLITDEVGLYHEFIGRRCSDRAVVSYHHHHHQGCCCISCSFLDVEICSRWRDLKQQFDLKSQEAQLLSDRLKQSVHGQQLDDIDGLKATISEICLLVIIFYSAEC